MYIQLKQFLNTLLVVLSSSFFLGNNIYASEVKDKTIEDDKNEESNSISLLINW